MIDAYVPRDVKPYMGYKRVGSKFFYKLDKITCVMLTCFIYIPLFSI